MSRNIPYLTIFSIVVGCLSNLVLSFMPLFAKHRPTTIPAAAISIANPAPNATPMTTHHATGTFEVNMTPQGEGEKSEGIATGRLTLDKQFHGGIEGKGKGEMLTAMTDVPGSAGYVAIERVTGTLDGRGGSFVFQHAATMTRGTPEMSITVVPDSGTGQLKGLAGRFMIKVAEGKHSYDFEYTLPGEG